MTQPLLAIRDLTIDYAGHVQAVRKANLEVRLGEAVGLVGESGSGKSTLASAIPGLLPDSARIQGDITFKDKNIAGNQRAFQKSLGNHYSTVSGNDHPGKGLFKYRT